MQVYSDMSSSGGRGGRGGRGEGGSILHRVAVLGGPKPTTVGRQWETQNFNTGTLTSSCMQLIQ